MFAAGERRGAGKAEQVVREGVEPQRRLKRIRQLLFGDRLDDQREAVLPPQERPAARRFFCTAVRRRMRETQSVRRCV